MLLDTIPKAMQLRVAQDIKRIELEFNVTVLYACESGSRAWGFASADSDYDVRFIYVNKLPWYLTTQAKRDVIERPIIDELDINGWELRKALQLLQASNPALLEWLQSPIVYYQHEVIKELQRLAEQYYSPIKAHYHYASMANKNFRGYLQAEEVRYKKYLYVLRPLLAVSWINKGLGVVPILFDQLLELITDSELRADIEELLRLKKMAGEAEYSARRPIIQQFIENELKEICHEPITMVKSKLTSQHLDDYLYKTVMLFHELRYG